MVCRLEQGEALDHPRRRAIYDAIVLEPGQTFRALAKRVAIPPGTLNHHLTVLSRSGLVWCTYHGCKRRHFPGTKPVTDALVRQELAVHGLDAIDQQVLAFAKLPGLNQKAILDQFPDIPRSSVQWRLRRLTTQGFLAVRRMGRRIVYDVGFAS